MIGFLRRHPEAGGYIVTGVAPFAGAAQAMQDWDADPGGFTKIIIDGSGLGHG